MATDPSADPSATDTSTSAAASSSSSASPAPAVAKGNTEPEATVSLVIKRWNPLVPSAFSVPVNGENVVVGVDPTPVPQSAVAAIQHAALLAGIDVQVYAPPAYVIDGVATFDAGTGSLVTSPEGS